MNTSEPFEVIPVGIPGVRVPVYYETIGSDEIDGVLFLNARRQDDAGQPLLDDGSILLIKEGVAYAVGIKQNEGEGFERDIVFECPQFPGYENGLSGCLLWRRGGKYVFVNDQLFRQARPGDPLKFCLNPLGELQIGCVKQLPLLHSTLLLGRVRQRFGWFRGRIWVYVDKELYYQEALDEYTRLRVYLGRGSWQRQKVKIRKLAIRRATKVGHSLFLETHVGTLEISLLPGVIDRWNGRRLVHVDERKFFIGKSSS